jgi:hypothetical protein
VVIKRASGPVLISVLASFLQIEAAGPEKVK